MISVVSETCMSMVTSNKFNNWVFKVFSCKLSAPVYFIGTDHKEGQPHLGLTTVTLESVKARVSPYYFRIVKILYYAFSIRSDRSRSNLKCSGSGLIFKFFLNPGYAARTCNGIGIGAQNDGER